MPKPIDRDACLRGFHGMFPQYDPALVEGIFDCAVQVVQENCDTSQVALLSEVEEMARTLKTARAEIAALGADEIRVSHIPSATDELDAIIVHTATATNVILESCELLEKMAIELNLAGKKLVRDVTTQIYEACTFQDITGQRITKVVATLKIIEGKVAHIVDAFAPTRTQSTNLLLDKRVLQPSLLNGPQLVSAAMDQRDVDALMAGLD